MYKYFNDNVSRGDANISLTPYLLHPCGSTSSNGLTLF